MSWFGQVPVASILPKKSYYFLTSGRIEEGFFELSGHDSIIVTNGSIKELPEVGRCFAVPREIIDKLQPDKHFTVRMRLNVNRRIHNFGEIPLGDVLTESVWKYRQEPRFLTRAFFSCGEPCVDLGDSIVVLSCGEIIPKFSDDHVWEKLNKALNSSFNHINHFPWPEFTIKSPDGNVIVTVGVSLSREMKDFLTGKHVGTFTVPTKQ